MTAKKRINLVPATVATLQFSDREKAAMDAATLYLPDDGTDWPKHVEAAITMLCNANERSRECSPTESPAYLAIVAMDLMGLDYCRQHERWYLRLVDKAHRTAFYNQTDDAALRLADYARQYEHVSRRESYADEVITERWLRELKESLARIAVELDRD